MMNQDLLLSAKTLLGNLKVLRNETDQLNRAFIAAMGTDDPVVSVREMLPSIVQSSDKVAAVIAEVFLTVDWEKDGNDAQVLYDILAGKGDIPEELKADVQEHLDSLGGTEKEMIDLFGENPMMSSIQKLGLEEELVDLVTSNDEVQAMVAAMQQTPNIPVITQE